jgi:hypothetical protein
LLVPPLAILLAVCPQIIVLRNRQTGHAYHESNHVIENIEGSHAHEHIAPLYIASSNVVSNAQVALFAMICLTLLNRVAFLTKTAAFLFIIQSLHQFKPKVV